MTVPVPVVEMMMTADLLMLHVHLLHLLHLLYLLYQKWRGMQDQLA